MASVISKIIGCECAFCAAEMAGELFRNLSEKCPLKGLAPVFGVEPTYEPRCPSRALVPVFGVDSGNHVIKFHSQKPPIIFQ